MKVLLVTYRREDLLKKCVSQLRSYFAISDLLVVDNRSDESTGIAEYCAAQRIGLIQNDRNEGFAKAVNIGMRRILEDDRESWVMLINPDAELLLDPHELIRYSTANTACLTAFDASAGRPWDCTKPIPNPWRAAWEDSGFGRVRVPQPLGSRYRSFSEKHKGYLVGCLLVVSTLAWRLVGEFDERFWLYSEETDWCLRVHKAGMKCTVIPIPGYRHHAGQASAGDDVAVRKTMDAYHRSRLLFIEKHWGVRGIRAYALVLSSLLGVRRLVRVGRRFIRNP